MTREELKLSLDEHNWDDGFELPKRILRDPNCDLALALEIFYLAEGNCYLSEGESFLVYEDWQAEWHEFVINLHDEILLGRYPKTDAAFAIPLNRVARYKLAKKNVPEVFLTDL